MCIFAFFDIVCALLDAFGCVHDLVEEIKFLFLLLGILSCLDAFKLGFDDGLAVLSAQIQVVDDGVEECFLHVGEVVGGAHLALQRVRFFSLFILVAV